jgi:hypothetical protein
MRKCFKLAAFLVLSTGPVFGAELRGKLSGQPSGSTGLAAPAGYVRMQVAEPAPPVGDERRPSLFLKALDTLPIPPPTEPSTMVIRGYRFQPAITTCAVDGQVEFRLEDSGPMTLLVDNQPIGTVEAGESLRYTCASGAAGDTLRTVTVREHPFMRAAAFVGEVGISVRANEDGSFAVQAPRGTYELLTVGPTGVMVRQPVEVGERGTQDLGVVGSPATEATE